MPALPARPTAVMGILSTMPVQRAAANRAGRHVPNLSRGTNIEAIFGQIVGQVSPWPCTHCAGNHGPWTLCITVPGYFTGSCANCHFGSQGRRCSLRTYTAPCELTSTNCNRSRNRSCSRPCGRPCTADHPKSAWPGPAASQHSGDYG